MLEAERSDLVLELANLVGGRERRVGRITRTEGASSAGLGELRRSVPSRSAHVQEKTQHTVIINYTLSCVGLLHVLVLYQ